MNTGVQHRELAEAACRGIREYLGTIRGLAMFGGGAKVWVNLNMDVIVVHGDGSTTTFTPVSAPVSEKRK